ncbi:MAG: lipase maturation factor family protein [Candidatus Andersenbacteria bacterium]|nr:lipase maturation factor family protein [Candidatus Andersenbacteria bacterium]
MLAHWRRQEYWFARLVIQRGLAGIYLVAFLAVAFQWQGLLGEHGLLPVPAFLEQASLWQTPSLFWLYYSDEFVAALAWVGVFLAALALLGLSERFNAVFSMMVWSGLYVLYLSFVNVGQDFFGFGWESILLEAGFLAIWLGPRRAAAPVAVIWLLRWLLFRVMFGAGLIKLRGDSCWYDLTCLLYHYETQPLPGPLSWYFHYLPPAIHKLGVMYNHLVELIVPWLYFVPALAAAAAGLTVLFHGMLIASGNLSWLNWLTIVLAASCISDRTVRWWLRLTPPEARPAPAWHLGTVKFVVLGTVLLSVFPVVNMASAHQAMNVSFNPFHLVGSYGAFGSVTKERYEVVLEGTRDYKIGGQTEWHEYAFVGKPGDPTRRLPQVAPYHLRLDWLMWFASFSPQAREVWFFRLADKLLHGEPAVLKLLARDGNPFSDAPPAYIRARLYRYRFTTATERRRTGAWWHRELAGEYLPPIEYR